MSPSSTKVCNEYIITGLYTVQSSNDAPSYQLFIISTINTRVFFSLFLRVFSCQLRFQFLTYLSCCFYFLVIMISVNVPSTASNTFHPINFLFFSSAPPSPSTNHPFKKNIGIYKLEDYQSFPLRCWEYKKLILQTFSYF